MFLGTTVCKSCSFELSKETNGPSVTCSVAAVGKNSSGSALATRVEKESDVLSF